MSVPEDLSLKAYAFKMIIFEGFSFDKSGTIRKEWENTGWTFVKSPEKKVEISTYSERFSELEQRYEWYKTHKKELIDLNKGLMKLRNDSINQLSQENLDEILDLANYAQAIKKAIEINDNENWVKDPISFVKEAWMAPVSKSMIGVKEKYIFDPADDPTGGNTEEQTLGESGRETDENKDCMKILDECLNEISGDLAGDVSECIEKSPVKSVDCNWASIRHCFTNHGLVEDWEGALECIDQHCTIAGDEDEKTDLKLCLFDAFEKWFKRIDTYCGKKYRECLGE